MVETRASKRRASEQEREQPQPTEGTTTRQWSAPTLASPEFPEIITDVPAISYPHLRDVLNAKEENDRTISSMLTWVELNGAVEERGYNPETRAVVPGSSRFFLDWTTVPNSGLNPKRLNFTENIKRAVLELGAVIGEFQIRPDYDESGKDIYRGEAQIQMSRTPSSDNKFSGHTVNLIGWGVENNDGTMEENLEYLDSKGLDFGEDGRGRLLTNNVLHWAYIPRLRRWLYHPNKIQRTNTE